MPVGELVTLAADATGAFEQCDQAGRETIVAGIHGVLGIADEMGETELMVLGGKALLPP